MRGYEIASQPGRKPSAICVAVGLPLTLRQLGIASLDPAQARLIAERAMAPGETSHNEPFELTWPAVSDAIRAADALGRVFLDRSGTDRQGR